jgi:ADP-heptose:LPS heptosyltransferase
MKRMLFITATRIGDAVLSTGLLNHLIEKHQDLQITVACGPAAASLFEAVPGLEQLIVLNKKPFSMHWPQLWQTCVGHIWDVLVDLRSSPMPFFLLARNRFYRGESRSLEHRVRQLGAIVGHETNPPAPRLWIDDEHAQTAARLIPDGGPVLALGPTANWAAKVWRADNFSELVRRLTGPDGLFPGARIAVFGAEGERAIAQDVIESIPEERRLDLLGKIDLLTVFACLKRCAFYVGNDSGLMHIAAASGTPTLGLFGPSQDVYYAPWGGHCDVVRTSTPYLDLFSPEFDHTTSGTLMDSLSVDAAEEAARILWQRTAKRTT